MKPTYPIVQQKLVFLLSKSLRNVPSKLMLLFTFSHVFKKSVLHKHTLGRAFATGFNLNILHKKIFWTCFIKHFVIDYDHQP